MDIAGEHSRARLACGRIVFGEGAVDADVVEGDAFAGEALQHQVVHGPKGVFGERSRAQPVLIGHHHEFEVEAGADKMQVAELEFQFLERIELVVDGRFNHECSVAVDKQDFLFHGCYVLA